MAHPVRRIAPPWPALLLLLILAAAVWRMASPRPHPGIELPAGEYQRVARVIDGDTLLLDNGQRVRLIGVDTPETKHPDRPIERWGPEAAELTRRLVEGRTVRLEFDRHRLDAYRRILAYVYIGDRLLNEELILAGLSAAETGFPFRSEMQRRFRMAEQQAREARRGLWSSREAEQGPSQSR